MKKFVLLVLALALLAPGFALAEPAQPVAEGYRLTEDGIDIALWENASTGYQWSYEIDDETVLVYGSEQTILDQGENAGDVVGAPAMHIWSFSAKADGEALITFYYERPGGDNDVELDAPVRTLCYTVTVQGGKATDCLQEDLSETDSSDDEGAVPYEGETGGVPLDVFEGMTQSETDEGTLLTSEDGLTTILIKYEPTDDAEELFEQLKDDEAAAKIYNDEANGVSVILCSVDREADIPSVTMLSYIENGVSEYTGYKAPDGGVLHVHTTYLLGDDSMDYEQDSDLDENG